MSEAFHNSASRRTTPLCHRSAFVAWLAATLTLFFALGAQAQGVPRASPFLKEMPPPEKVSAAFTGKDRLELAAQRAGAMYQMREIVWTLAEGRQFTNRLTTEESRLASDYIEAYGKISSPVIASFDTKETQRLGWNSPRAKWFGRRTFYETDPGFRRTLLARLFSADFQRNFALVQARQSAGTPNALRQQASVTAAATDAADALVQHATGELTQVSSRLEREVESRLPWMFLAGLLGTLLAIVGYSIRSYNTLQTKRQPIKKARSDVKIAIDRRCTAVNDLAQVAQSFAAGESFVQLQVSRDTSGAALASAYQQSAMLLNNVQSLAERYPNLKSSEHYLHLTQMIAECEREISYMRQYVNHVIEDFNKYALQFPRVLFAKLTGFKEEEYIELDVSAARSQASVLNLGQANHHRLDHVLGGPPQAAAPSFPSGNYGGNQQPQLAQQPAAPALPPAPAAARGGRTEAISSFPSVSLRFLSGPLGGHSVPIGTGCIVGRESPAAQLVVPDPQVSSAHAWIGVHPNGLIFVDRGSTNGSAVNGAPVRAGDEIPVKAGDVISLGRTNSVSFVVEHS